ncbi:MAG: DNA/RNA nuclease SfsA [Pseudomonadota bacterium]
MEFQTPLQPAILLRRYKRFLADIRLEDGREVTAHCPNPGIMMGLTTPGSRVWVEPNDDPRKKLKFGWRLLEVDSGHLVGVDTSQPNRILKPVLQQRGTPELVAYETVLTEKKYGENSRIDFLLQQDGLPDAYVEVKSVTTNRTPGLAEFPDCVTERGAKHLRELADVARAGYRAVLFYLVQRDDCDRVAVAYDLDPAYGKAFDDARNAGLEVLAYDTELNATGINIRRSLPVM